MKRLMLVVLITLVSTFGLSQTVYDIAAGNPAFSIFFTATNDAGLAEYLKQDNITVFLPTNDAFSRLPADVLSNISKNRGFLKEILKLHIAQGQFDAASFVRHPLINTLGSYISMSAGDGSFFAENAAISSRDIQATNGYVHVLNDIILPDRFLLPKEGQIRYVLDSQNNTGIIGTVVITGNEQQSIVSVVLSGTPRMGVHPAKIYYGDCASGGEIFVGLNDIFGSYGTSRTVLNLPILSLVKTNSYVSVSLSSEQSDHEVACGEFGLNAFAQ